MAIKNPFVSMTLTDLQGSPFDSLSLPLLVPHARTGRDTK